MFLFKDIKIETKKKKIHTNKKSRGTAVLFCVSFQVQGYALAAPSSLRRLPRRLKFFHIEITCWASWISQVHSTGRSMRLRYLAQTFGYCVSWKGWPFKTQTITYKFLRLISFFFLFFFLIYFLNFANNSCTFPLVIILLISITVSRAPIDSRC